MKVFHLVASFKLRGAEVFARDLFVALRGLGVKGRLLRLEDGPDQLGVVKELEGATLDGETGLGKIKALRRVVGIEQPDIIMAHGGQALKYATMATIGLDIPIIYRKIGLTEKWLGRWRAVKMPWLKCLLNRAAVISAVGDTPRQELIDLFDVPDWKVRTIYRGASLEQFEAGQERADSLKIQLDLSNHHPVLLAAGALSWEKNLGVMVRAMALVVKEFPGAVLLCAGEGPERSSLERLVEKCGVRGHVRFLGVQEDMPALFALADICLLTSLTEGVPGVLIEAGLTGTPCVTWAVAGASEVIRNGETGRVTPFGDEEAFTEALLEMLRGAENTKNQGMQAKTFCQGRFDIRRSAREHLQLFEEILEKRG